MSEGLQLLCQTSTLWDLDENSSTSFFVCCSKFTSHHSYLGAPRQGLAGPFYRWGDMAWSLLNLAETSKSQVEDASDKPRLRANLLRVMWPVRGELGFKPRPL